MTQLPFSYPAIDGERLLADLHTLRGFGAVGRGVVRPSLSPEDIASRHWLRQRMADAGLDATLDGVGNVIGRSPQPGPALLLGSHTDTQPLGGWLDGVYGVIAALEVARTLRHDPVLGAIALDVASFIDEEGTHYSFLGSLSASGQLDQPTLDAARCRDGSSLPERLHAAGLDGRVAPLDLRRYAGFIELHIEQGPVLDDGGKRLGVVSGIVGARNIDIVVSGEANHAGTTPMARRHDAGRALIALASAIEDTFSRTAGPETVWNIGRMSFQPGAAAIVPERAELRLQFRDLDSRRLDRLEAALQPLAADIRTRWQVGVDIARAGQPTLPAHLSPVLQAHLVRATERRASGAWITLPSGAMHDAGIFAQVMPAAMLFVPSLGGRSHCPEEDTRPDDLILGAQALADAVVDWARFTLPDRLPARK